MRLRTARPTNELAAIERFYVQGLGLAVSSRFEGHAGFDGLILRGEGWELEFVVEAGVVAPSAPTREHLLVGYWSSVEVEAKAAALRALGFQEVEPNNPWWRTHGVTFADPDGYHVVLARAQDPRVVVTPPHVQLRLATEADLAALTALHAPLWNEATTPAGGPPAGLDTDRTTFVAEGGGALLGAVQLGRRTSFPSNAHVASLTWLAVSPVAQGTGVGAALTAHVVAEARAQGFRKLSLNVLASNTRAVALYESLGFVCEARRVAEYWLQGRWVDSLEYALGLT